MLKCMMPTGRHQQVIGSWWVMQGRVELSTGYCTLQLTLSCAGLLLMVTLAAGMMWQVC